MGAASLSTPEYEQAGLGLSAGTELVLFLSGMEMNYFLYCADGVTVTSFEPLMSAWRDGTETAMGPLLTARPGGKEG